MEVIVNFIDSFVLIRCQEEPASPQGSDKIAEEEGEDLDDEEEYDEEEEEEDEDRPRKKPRHGGFILDEAGTNLLLRHPLINCPCCPIRHLLLFRDDFSFNAAFVFCPSASFLSV